MAFPDEFLNDVARRLWLSDRFKQGGLISALFPFSWALVV
jgi:hypothetical protein